MWVPPNKSTQETGSGGPTAMEVTLSSPTQPDPRQSPPEVNEESIREDQPPGNSITESPARVLLQCLTDILKDNKQAHANILSVVASLNNTLSQLTKPLGEIKNSVPSVEGRVWDSQQTNSEPQSDPRVVPAASSSSFSSHQMILDDVQTMFSPGSTPVYTGGASIEPAASLASEEFRTASNTLVCVETEEEAPQMLPDSPSRKRETAHIEAEKSDHQVDTLSGASPQEYNPEPQTSTGTLPEAHQIRAAVWSQERTSESEKPSTEAEESDHQDDTLSGASTQEYNPEPWPSTSTLPEALQILAAAWSQESETPSAEAEESDHQVNTFSGASPQEYNPEPQPSMSTLPETPQLTAPAAVQKEAPVRAKRLFRRCTSAGYLSCLVSSPPAKVRPPTKHQQRSMIWNHFISKSNNVATCKHCNADVRTSIPGSTGAYLQHLKRRHEKLARSKLKAPPAEVKPPTKGRRTSIVWNHFISKSNNVATCKHCGVDVKTGVRGSTAGQHQHLKHHHEKLARSELKAKTKAKKPKTTCTKNQKPKMPRRALRRTSATRRRCQEEEEEVASNDNDVIIVEAEFQPGTFPAHPVENLEAEDMLPTEEKDRAGPSASPQPGPSAQQPDLLERIDGLVRAMQLMEERLNAASHSEQLVEIQAMLDTVQRILNDLLHTAGPPAQLESIRQRLSTLEQSREVYPTPPMGQPDLEQRLGHLEHFMERLMESSMAARTPVEQPDLEQRVDNWERFMEMLKEYIMAVRSKKEEGIPRGAAQNTLTSWFVPSVIYQSAKETPFVYDSLEKCLMGAFKGLPASDQHMITDRLGRLRRILLGSMDGN